MGPRPNRARPPRERGVLRDYRTLTMPALSRPPRAPTGAAHNAEDWPDQLTESAEEGYGAKGASRPTRTTSGVPARPPQRAGTDLVPREAETRPVARTNRRTSVALPATGGLLVMGSPVAREVALAGHARTGSRRLPVRLAGVLAILVALGLAVAAPRVSAIAADSTCAWYTVKPGNTLNDISMAHHLTAAALAQANHISTKSTLYVGQRLCIPTAWWSSAQLAPAVPDGAELALPPGILAGEPCTEDRAIVWTVPVSQWAVPPGCFGQIFYPNPLDYMVNGQVIGGFGWCNWWPEALLRDPNALSLPEHSEVRVGWPVFYHPVNGEHVGHYAFVESIGPNGWILISEMNMNWRGAGWARVNYRYIRVDYPGVAYLYPNS